MEEGKVDVGKKAGRVYTVRLEGMEFYSFHGVLQDEKKDGNTFVVDLEYDYSSVCGATDTISDAVDYSAVYDIVKQIMAVPHELLESLASEICEGVMQACLKIERIEVCVKKKNPPVGGPCAWSTVTTCLRRK